jgi:tetratricopeptide (TPR) repeat protein
MRLFFSEVIMAELDAALVERLEVFAEEANSAAEDENFDEAVKIAREALALIPEPVLDYSETGWFHALIGDIRFAEEDFDGALDGFQIAVSCPEGLGNPFLHLRLGECHFELGNLDKAADELMRAYMSEGAEIFENEDPKYLEFLGTRAKLEPIGH